MEKRINPDQVSHITISDTHKGKKSYYDGILEYTFRPEYKHWFWTDYPQGYYRKGQPQSSWTSCFEEIPESCFDKDGELWSYPLVSVFCGEKRLETTIFETVEEAKDWTRNNFPNCNVIIK